ncbi:hypothetical protein NM688_g6655 [Phlebia brevispora]|uniref:Uncharacterized protein n=1 Tax=Phlebia brevispora TaxID=194682 RepID=A0ACC1SDS6_9APHY|nr:hypothetical protein NM688_g6655 [Phlebia brevispora]
MPGVPVITFDTTLGAAFIGFTFALMYVSVPLASLVIPDGPAMASMTSSVAFSSLDASISRPGHFGIDDRDQAPLGLRNTILYFHKCKNDTLLLRGVVLTLWLLDVLHTILIAHGTYTILVTFHLAPFQAVAKPPWSYSVGSGLCHGDQQPSSADGVRQSYIQTEPWEHHYSNNGYIAVVICPWYVPLGRLMECAHLIELILVATGMVFGTEALHAPSWASIKSFSWSLYSGYSAEMLADAIIAVSLCIILVRMRTGLRSSDTLVQALVMYSVNTGLMTTICVFLSLVTYLTLPNTLAFLACYFVLSKIYVNSLLGALNARSKMQASPRQAQGAPNGQLSGNSNTVTNSSGYTTSGTGSGSAGASGGLLTTAIVLEMPRRVSRVSTASTSYGPSRRSARSPSSRHRGAGMRG